MQSLKKLTKFYRTVEKVEGITTDNFTKQNGLVVQLVRMLPCHGRGRGFESRPARKKTKPAPVAGFFILFL